MEELVTKDSNQSSGCWQAMEVIVVYPSVRSLLVGFCGGRCGEQKRPRRMQSVCSARRLGVAPALLPVAVRRVGHGAEFSAATGGVSGWRWGWGAA